MIPSDLPVFGVFAADDPLPMLMCAFAVGFFIGIFCDIAKTGFSYFGSNKVLCFFADMFCVCGAYIFLFVCALNFFDGIIRWYHVLLLFCGYRTYFSTLSRPVVFVTGAVRNLVCKLISSVMHVILVPIRLIAEAAHKWSHLISEKYQHIKKENTFKREKRIMIRMASNGYFEDLPCVEDFNNKIKKDKKHGKQKNKQSDGSRDLSGFGTSSR